MSDTTKAKLWIALFILVIIAPVLALFIGPHPDGREFWRELSAALGFAGLALMGVQFIPTARLPFLAKLFPMDTLYAFHHKISIAGFTLALAHPLLLFAGNPYTLQLLNLFTAPWRARAGVVGMVLFILIIITSVWRKDLNVQYQNWRAYHDLFSIAATGLVLYHMFMVNNYMAHPFQRVYWIGSAGLWTVAVLNTRLLRPIQLLRRPYRVVSVRPERGDAWTLSLQPDGHPGCRFMAGQFAWLIARNSPFSFHDNPFSFSSSAENKQRFEFTIKEAGDFTALIKELQTGERVFVDGCYGTFDIDQHDAPGYVMIAGGIGSVPILSILRTMADREDQRPVIFFYGNRNWEKVTFREELEALTSQMNLKLVHVLEEPHSEWTGESGFITAEVLDRHLGDKHAKCHYFICGPIPMIAAIEGALLKLNVPLNLIHTENYEMA